MLKVLKILKIPNSIFSVSLIFLTIYSTSANCQTVILPQNSVIMPSNVPVVVQPIFSKEDSVITETIKKKLSTDPRISSPNINIKTVDGIVSLIGNFDSLDEVGAAIEIISSTPGVTDIDTSEVVLSIPITLSFDDFVITSRIKGLLIKEKVFGQDPDYVINVETNDGVVFLTGPVNNPAQMNLAIEIAKSVPDVKKVIVVKP